MSNTKKVKGVPSGAVSADGVPVNLQNLKVGEKVTIYLPDGRSRTYEVAGRGKPAPQRSAAAKALKAENREVNSARVQLTKRRAALNAVHKAALAKAAAK